MPYLYFYAQDFHFSSLRLLYGSRHRFPRRPRSRGRSCWPGCSRRRPLRRTGEEPRPAVVPDGGLLRSRPPGSSATARLEGFRVGEERLLQGQWSSGPAGGVPLQPERLQPTGLAEGVQPEEARLRRGRRRAEQHRRADELVIPLLGPGAQELDLLPVLGRLDAPLASVAAHVRFPSRYALPRRPRAVPREEKHATEGALPPARVCRQPGSRHASRTSWLGLLRSGPTKADSTWNQPT